MSTKKEKLKDLQRNTIFHAGAGLQPGPIVKYKQNKRSALQVRTNLGKVLLRSSGDKRGKEMAERLLFVTTGN